MSGAPVELPEAWRAHPLLVADTGRWVPRRVWSDDAALLALVDGAETGVRSAVGLGDPAALADLVVAAVNEGSPAAGSAEGPAWASLTRGTGRLLQGRLPQVASWHQVSAWDWFWTDATTLRAAPAPTGPGRVVELAAGGGPDTARVAELHAVALPGTSFSADRPGVRWTGWVADGELLAVAGAADRERATQLGGVATRPEARGRGLGAAVVTAAATAALEHTGLVSLGMYADNDAARSVYARLGFVVGQRFDSFERAAG